MCRLGGGGRRGRCGWRGEKFGQAVDEGELALICETGEIQALRVVNAL